MTARKLGEWTDRSPEWYAARAGRIGGSDIGKIFGWNPYCTADELVAERTDPTWERGDRTDSQRRGIYCEPAIKAWVADRAKVEWDESYRGTWVSADDDRWMYNPDGVTTDGRLGEFKTADVRDLEHGWGRALTDQVPLAYAAQAIWGCGILGLDSCLMGVLAGQPKFGFALYRVPFDQHVYDALRARADLFLNDLATRSAA